MRGEQVQGFCLPSQNPAFPLTPVSLQLGTCVQGTQGSRGGAEPIWSQVCWWQLGALGCLNHDLGGSGEVKSCTSAGQLAGWEGEDLALKLVHSQESACGALPGAGVRGNPGRFPVTARVCRKPWGTMGPHISSLSGFPSGLSRCWVLLCPFPKGVL